jgi:hypothetical protein
MDIRFAKNGYLKIPFKPFLWNGCKAKYMLARVQKLLSMLLNGDPLFSQELDVLKLKLVMVYYISSMDENKLFPWA